MLITVITYIIWGSAEVQSWNDNPNEENWIIQSNRRLNKSIVDTLQNLKARYGNKMNETVVNADEIPIENENKS